MKIVCWPFLFFALFLSACAPGSKDEQTSVTTTYSPPAPTVSQEGNYSVVHGATEVKDMVTQYDSSKKGLFLRGKINVRPIDGTNPFVVEVDLEGQSDRDGFVVMKAGANQPALPPDVKMGVKATCLGKDNQCTSSFIDIYIQYREKVYHHQVESHETPAYPVPGKEQEKPTTPTKPGATAPTKPSVPAAPSEPKKPDTKPEDKKTDPKKTEVKTTPEIPDGEDEVDEGGGELEANGRYVGDIQGDIEKILEPQNSDKTKTSTRSKLDQVIGPVTAGRLEKATNLLAYEIANRPAGFHIVNPQRERYFGSIELVYLIAKMGEFTKKLIPNYALPIGDLSRKTGGKLGSHASHQNGLDVDIAFYFRDAKIQGNLFSALQAGKSGKPVVSWMPEEQWKLFKSAISTKYVDRIFIHQTLKSALCQIAIKNGEIKEGQTEGDAYELLRRLRPEKNHYNHFHLRVKCSKTQVRCRQMADPAPGTGCF
ncbi:penicillin-insensitive murein endopeptidase [Bdellovibrio svalbardensis]|uniref:Penicillin-insensitive murein endopeptidase n=1 Tax=Bdellovibrio svalbardensis TaxID=2972972 RepID=A0ABT6DMW7_9BACT|nr:penicillin-insensitive murein endopeptidase [Bdellovibrio svalbardensis]MDG0817959.1 penicillin-insensitive murein endopeptidase [Bdellovibrio svalbardensis]